LERDPGQEYLTLKEHVEEKKKQYQKEKKSGSTEGGRDSLAMNN